MAPSLELENKRVRESNLATTDEFVTQNASKKHDFVCESDRRRIRGTCQVRPPTARCQVESERNRLTQ